MQNAYNQIEAIAWRVRDVADAHRGDGSIPNPPPSYEDVGRLYLFANYVKTVAAAQIVERADEILEELVQFEDIIINPSRKAA